ncbi:MAG: class I tRNA ligase family protein, partial [archaeon]|nr:class I tRNA ligase family protein [archaeon]
SAKEIENFIIEILSQRYIPMTRGEIWDDSKETLNRRLAIYATLDDILTTLDILFHPISPYLTEFLYQTLHAKYRRQKATILLESWPTPNPNFIDKELELEFELITDLVSLANSARMKARLKRRWPLRRTVFLLQKEKISKVEKHKENLRDQINVKEVLLASSLKEAKITLNVRPNYVALGPKLKEKMPKLVSLLGSTNPFEIYDQLKDKGFIMMKIDDEGLKITKDELEMTYTSDEKHMVLEKDGFIISLDTERNRDLIAEGTIRDLARRMQNLRKERGYNPTDIIEGAYVACLDDELLEQIRYRSEDLTFLVRVKNVHISKEPFEGVNWVDVEMDGRGIKISVE